MDDICKNIGECSSSKEQKIAIELFITRRKLNIFLVFITQTYFAVPLQQIAFNHSSDMIFQDLVLWYHLNREAAQISAILSCTIDKYEFLTDEEILPSVQSRKIKQAKFTNSPLGKAFEKQIKTIEAQLINQVETLKALKSEENKEDVKSIERIVPKDMRTTETKNKIVEIKKWSKGN